MNVTIAIVILNHIVAAVYLFGVNKTPMFGLSPWVVCAALYFFYGIVGINVGYHRFFSHGAFKTSFALKVALLVSTIPAGLGSIFSWAYVHRKHHKHSDTELDPHSPHVIGALRVFFLKYQADKKFDFRIVKDLLKDKLIMWQHTYYLHLMSGLYILVGLWNLQAVAILISIPSLLCLYGLGAVTVCCHLFGYRNLESADKSFNNIFAATVSLGEGWHHNHHLDPANPRQGMKWWEFDPPYLVICLIRSRK